MNRHEVDSPGWVGASWMQLTPADEAGAPGVIDNAVDKIVETVLSKQGRVVFVEDGSLDAHQRIALVLRY